jgi:glutathione synthase/RimK-type ligase-like ATP-grasp enzyme
MYRLRLNTVKGPSSYGLCLPEKTLAGLQITPNKRYEVQVGQRVIRTGIGVAPVSRITAELKQKLRLPPGVLRLHIARRDDRLVLGPFLGILARPQRSTPYGEQTSFFRRLIARAKAMHIYAYVFGLDDVNWKGVSVTGHRPYKTTTTWVTRVCPIPDVVFDRGFFKAAERRKAVKTKTRLIEEYGAHLFNEDVGNKWDVYQMLLSDPDLAEYLPETAKAESTDVLTDFISRHRVIYVKPAAGNQGRHVFRVRRRRDRVSYEMHERRGRIVRTSVPTMSAFMQDLAATKERSVYLVQQGLTLAKVKGNAADVRALVQRDRHGVWQLTGIGVRIGGSGLVSNLHAGGCAAKIDILLPRAERKAQVPALKARIKDLSLRVAHVLSKRHLLGELGVDLGVDKQGRLWIIEVNLRPGRATFRRAGLTEAWRRSGIAPLEFTIYLWARKGTEMDADGDEAVTSPADTVDADSYAVVNLDAADSGESDSRTTARHSNGHFTAIEDLACNNCIYRGPDYAVDAADDDDDTEDSAADELQRNRRLATVEAPVDTGAHEPAVKPDAGDAEPTPYTGTATIGAYVPVLTQSMNTVSGRLID